MLETTVVGHWQVDLTHPTCLVETGR